jgi:hypothetical protein
LAEIKSEHDQKSIELFLKAADPTGLKLFWIGMTDLFQEGTWMWEPSHELASYFNWNKGQPDNNNGTEHFAHLYNAASSYKWNDCKNDNCKNSMMALCQKIL